MTIFTSVKCLEHFLYLNVHKLRLNSYLRCVRQVMKLCLLKLVFSFHGYLKIIKLYYFSNL